MRPYHTYCVKICTRFLQRLAAYKRDFPLRYSDERSTFANYLLLRYKSAGSSCYRIEPCKCGLCIGDDIFIMYRRWYFYFILQGQQSIKESINISNLQKSQFCPKYTAFANLHVAQYEVCWLYSSFVVYGQMKVLGQWNQVSHLRNLVSFKLTPQLLQKTSKLTMKEICIWHL